MPRITNIQPRGGTAAQWNSANPVLAAREIAVETDTLQIKIGNGSSNWVSLPYVGGGNPAAALEEATIALGGTGDRAFVTPTLTGTASMLDDSANRLGGGDGAKFFTLFDARGKLSSPLDNFYGYVAGHDSTQIWLVTGPTPSGPWTWRQAVRTLANSPLVGDNHISSPEVLWYNGKVNLYYHGAKPGNTTGQPTVLATSTDGVNFTEESGYALDVAYSADRTRYYALSTSYVRIVSTGAKLAAVFQGNTSLVNSQVGSVTCSVGYATSNNGSKWRISQVPLIVADIGTSGPFSPTLAKIGNMWMCAAYTPARNGVDLYISETLEPGSFRRVGVWFTPPSGFDWIDSPTIKYLDGEWHIWFGATDSTYVRKGEIFHAVLNWSI